MMPVSACENACEEVEEGGLAGAAGAKECDLIASSDVKSFDIDDGHGLAFGRVE